MTESSEQRKLKKEIQALTSLINSHKQQRTWGNTDNTQKGQGLHGGWYPHGANLHNSYGHPGPPAYSKHPSKHFAAPQAFKQPLSRGYHCYSSQPVTGHKLYRFQAESEYRVKANSHHLGHQKLVPKQSHFQWVSPRDFSPVCDIHSVADVYGPKALNPERASVSTSGKLPLNDKSETFSDSGSHSGYSPHSAIKDTDSSNPRVLSSVSHVNRTKGNVYTIKTVKPGTITVINSKIAANVSSMSGANSQEPPNPATHALTTTTAAKSKAPKSTVIKISGPTQHTSITRTNSAPLSSSEMKADKTSIKTQLSSIQQDLIIARQELMDKMKSQAKVKSELLAKKDASVKTKTTAEAKLLQRLPKVGELSSQGVDNVTEKQNPVTVITRDKKEKSHKSITAAVLPTTFDQEIVSIPEQVGPTQKQSVTIPSDISKTLASPDVASSASSSVTCSLQGTAAVSPVKTSLPSASNSVECSPANEKGNLPHVPESDPQETSVPIASQESVAPNKSVVSVSSTSSQTMDNSSNRSQSPVQLTKSGRPVTHVSRYSFVKFAKKYKWVCKSAEAAKQGGEKAGVSDVEKPTSVHAEMKDETMFRFSAKHRDRYTGHGYRGSRRALESSRVPHLLAKIEDSQALNGDPSENVKLMRMIQLLESEVNAAKQARNMQISPSKGHYSESSGSPFKRKYSVQRGTKQNYSPWEETALVTGKVVTHKDGAGRLKPTGTRGLILDNAQYRRSQEWQSSRSAKDHRNKSRAAALIVNKYKLVRQKSTSQYDITRYKMTKKTIPLNTEGASMETDHNDETSGHQKSPMNKFQYSQTPKTRRWSMGYKSAKNRAVVSKKVGGQYKKALSTRSPRRYHGSFGYHGNKDGRHRKQGRGKKNTMWNTRYSLRRDNSDGMSLNQLIGRHVENMSKNRYKFIKGSKNTGSSDSSGTNKYKVDHRSKRDYGAQRASRPIMIGGVPYQGNSKQLHRASPRAGAKHVLSKGPAQRVVVSVRGVKYRVDSAGRALQRIASKEAPKGNQLKRVHLAGVIYVETKPGTLVRAKNTATIKTASQFVTKSKARAVAASSRPSKDRQYCIFYNRFGKCNRGDKCPYIHDPDKVAICTRFLRGTCKVTDCPFSHKVAQHKMPVCVHYLRGVCSRDNCPYLHVNVGRDAEVCQDFLRGICTLGDKCKKKHWLVCQEWLQSGTCSKGRKCGMRHPARGRKRRRTSTCHDQAPRKEEKQAENTEGKNSKTDDASLPWKQRKLPSFISLEHETSLDSTVNSSAISFEADEEPLKIWPNLSLAGDEVFTH